MLASAVREQLLAAILEFVSGHQLFPGDDIRALLEREIDAAGVDGLADLHERLTVDRGWDYHPRDPLAQRLHHLLADRFLRSDSHVAGVDALADLSEAPLVIVANHLSYADANVVEVLLQRAGKEMLANRLTALAGPKVFTSRQRRFSSLCFGTIKVPQSADVASAEAVLSARDVARAARRAIDVAHRRLRDGDVLLLFGEGTRSRSGGMQPMLPAAARYLEVPGTVILPIGLTGSETLFPLAAETVQPATVELHIGHPQPAGELFARTSGDRRQVMDDLGKAVARLLPQSYRGVYS
jgi:1-acyl-sn-glycerol-3-phosphate acyltransferase